MSRQRFSKLLREYGYTKAQIEKHWKSHKVYPVSEERLRAVLLRVDFFRHVVVHR